MTVYIEALLMIDVLTFFHVPSSSFGVVPGEIQYCPSNDENHDDVACQKIKVEPSHRSSIPSSNSKSAAVYHLRPLGSVLMQQRVQRTSVRLGLNIIVRLEMVML